MSPPSAPSRLHAAAATFAILVATPAVLAGGAVPAVAAAAQQNSNRGTASSLDLTLDTGGTRSATAPRLRLPITMAAAPRATAPRRSSASTRSSRGRAAVTARRRSFSRDALPSSANSAAAQQQVLGNLGVVTAARANIYRDADSQSRVLSPVPQDTYIAVGGQRGEFYGVRMIDGSTGWINKEDVRLVPFEVAVRDPNAPPPAAPSVTDDASGATASWGEYLQSLQGHDQRAAALLQEAFTYLGVPYVWAGNTRSGLDCSGFVKNVFASQGFSLPRHSGDQARVGLLVAPEDLRPGDRLYFDMGSKGRISHTGIYLGNGYFIHASSNQGKVGVDVLGGNYLRGLVVARR
jgi:cell wall-associated NlpC family hydrolase